MVSSIALPLETSWTALFSFSKPGRSASQSPARDFKCSKTFGASAREVKGSATNAVVNRSIAMRLWIRSLGFLPGSPARYRNCATERTPEDIQYGSRRGPRQAVEGFKRRPVTRALVLHESGQQRWYLGRKSRFASIAMNRKASVHRSQRWQFCQNARQKAWHLRPALSQEDVARECLWPAQSNQLAC